MSARPDRASAMERTDPRTRFVVGLSVAVGVALPLAPALCLLCGIAVLVVLSGSVDYALRQLKRLWVPVLIVFAVNWVVAGPYLATLVSVRVLLLSQALVVFSATIRINELYHTLRWMRLPPRIAFGTTVALHSVELMRIEWRRVRDAQRARGIDVPSGKKAIGLLSAPCRAIPLVVPAVSLAVHRAWHVTEAAVLRGFGAPQATGPAMLGFSWRDALLVLVWFGFIGATLRYAA